MATDHERIAVLRRHGFTNEAIAAILNSDVPTVSGGDLPAGGGGASNVIEATDVADQTITLVAAGVPQDVEALWRIDGPGQWMVSAWYEVKPADDNDFVGLSLIADTDLGAALVGSSGGPDARAFVNAGEILTGGWIRQRMGDSVPTVLVPSQWRDYTLQIIGWHYNEADPGDTTLPVLGNAQIRNVRVVATRLDA